MICKTVYVYTAGVNVGFTIRCIMTLLICLPRMIWLRWSICLMLSISDE